MATRPQPSPLHSLEAEQSLIGGLLLDNSVWDRIADIVSQGDFFCDDHRRIFTHIRRLIEMARPADVVTVFDSIKNSNEIDQTGGMAYLGEIANATPSAANIRRYAEIVRERAAVRRAIGIAADLASAAPHSLLNALSAAKGELESLAARAAGLQLPDAPRVSTLAAAAQIQFDYVLPGLRRGNVGVIGGYGGVGKGFLGLSTAVDVALGRGTMTRLPLCRPGPVVFLSIEDDQDALNSRLQSIAKHLTPDELCTLDENLRVVSVYGRREWQLLAREDRVLRPNTAALSTLIHSCRGTRLLVLDTARKFFQFEENRSDEASLVLSVCDEIARRAGPAIVLLHHLVKPSGDRRGTDAMPTIHDIRGSSALVADARWCAVLATPSDERWKLLRERYPSLQPDESRRHRILITGKVNHAGEPDDLLLAQQAGGVLKHESWPRATVVVQPSTIAPGNLASKFGLRRAPWDSRGEI